MDSRFVNTANRACSLIYSYIKKYNQGTWLLPVNVCPDVPLTFNLAGIDIEFVDIDSTTLCIDTQECLARLARNPNKYAGIVYVRTYGFLTDTSQFVRDCKSITPSLKIIDDRCLCIPQRNPHSYNADMVLYSTGHCKQIDLSGGGLAYYQTEEPYVIDSFLLYDGTDEEALYKEAYAKNDRMRKMPKGWLKLSNYKAWQDYMQEIEEKVSDRLNYRDKLNRIYSRNLPKTIQFDSKYNDWRFNIMVPSSMKQEILRALFDKGLFASTHYHSVNRLFNKDKYPVSDALFSKVINLFNDKNYSEDMAKKTCDVIASFPLLGGVNLSVRNRVWIHLYNTIAA